MAAEATLSSSSGSDEICAYFERAYGVSVRPIGPPPEPVLGDASVPSAHEALALDGLLSRFPRQLVSVLGASGALTHILFLKTARRTSPASYNRGIIRLFPSALLLRSPDRMYPSLSVFEATVMHELSEAIYRLHLDQEPHRLAGIRSQCTPMLRELFEECYLWWLETGEPPGVTDETEPHVLAAIVTEAFVNQARGRRQPFRPLLEALGIFE